MKISKIIKRDGSVQPFDITKITDAIEKAMIATETGKRKDAEKVSKKGILREGALSGWFFTQSHRKFGPLHPPHPSKPPENQLGQTSSTTQPNESRILVEFLQNFIRASFFIIILLLFSFPL